MLYNLWYTKKLFLNAIYRYAFIYTLLMVEIFAGTYFRAPGVHEKSGTNFRADLFSRNQKNPVFLIPYSLFLYFLRTLCLVVMENSMTDVRRLLLKLPLLIEVKKLGGCY